MSTDLIDCIKVNRVNNLITIGSLRFSPQKPVTISLVMKTLVCMLMSSIYGLNLLSLRMLQVCQFALKFKELTSYCWVDRDSSPYKNRPPRVIQSECYNRNIAFILVCV